MLRISILIAEKALDALVLRTVDNLSGIFVQRRNRISDIAAYAAVGAYLREAETLKLFLTGTFPLWAVILAGSAVIALTIFMYRSENLPRPWSFVLPGIRCCVLLLLFLMLLQPILAWMHTSETSGKIPVILDNSGSMRVQDHLSPSQTVRYADALGRIPPEARNATFSEANEGLQDFYENLRQVLSKTNAIQKSLTGDADSSSSIEQLADLADQLSNLVTRLEEMEQRLRSQTKACEYLPPQRASIPPLSTPEDANVLYERYDDLPGWQTETLVKSDKYPGNPDKVRLISRLRAPRNVGEHYGARMRAVLTPPRSGLYRFFFSSDDQGKLWIGKKASSKSKSLVAEAPEWVPSPDTFTEHEEQKSEKIRLEKGTPYVIEALFKENQGNDHCTVKWVPPENKQAVHVPEKHLRAWPNAASYVRFRERYKKLFAKTETIKERLKTTIQQMKQAAKSENLLVAALQESIDHLSTAAGKTNAVISNISELQTYADAVLRSSTKPELRTAFKRVENMSRLEKLIPALQNILDSAEATDLRKNFTFLPLQTRVSPMKSPPATAKELQPYQEASRLGTTLSSISGFYKDTPVSAVILCTDGNSTGGISLKEATRRLRNNSIPVYTLGIGSVKPPPDIRIKNLSGPDTSFRGDKLTLKAVIERPGFERTNLEMQVYREDTLVTSKKIPPGNSSVVISRIQFIEKKGGARRYMVKLARKDGEILTRNNTESITVDVLTTPAKGLFIEQFPRWESRYIDGMFSNDPRLALDTVFLPPPQESARHETNKRLADTFTRLSRYDVIILGDVHPENFTENQLKKLLTFVRKRGNTLIFLAGSHYMPFAYKNKELTTLLPINLKPSKPSNAETGQRPQKPVNKLQLTRAGKSDMAVRLASTTEMTDKLWQNLPSPCLVHANIFPSETARVLVSADTDDISRRIPLLIQAYKGLGSVAFFNSDSFWRWRQNDGEKYHYRLWGQTMLWATTGTATTNGPFVTFVSQRRLYTPQEPVDIRIRVRDKQGRLKGEGPVTVSLRNRGTAKEQLEKNIKLQRTPGQKGVFHANVRNLPEGRYTVRPRLRNIPNERIEAVYRFRVKRLQTHEYLNLSMEKRNLKRASAKFYTIEDASEIPKQIPNVQTKRTRRREYQLWNSFWLLLVIGLLLGIEWQTRKTVMRI